MDLEQLNDESLSIVIGGKPAGGQGGSGHGNGTGGGDGLGWLRAMLRAIFR